LINGTEPKDYNFVMKGGFQHPTILMDERHAHLEAKLVIGRD
jgi:hypothetical protein